MSKEEAIEVEGVVVKALSNAKFSVELQNGHMVIAYPAGKMRKFFIFLILWTSEVDYMLILHSLTHKERTLQGDY